MQGGPVDELLDVAVERALVDQLEVEVGRTPEDRFQPGPTGDHRERSHLHAVHQTGGHQRPESPVLSLVVYGVFSGGGESGRSVQGDLGVGT